MKTPEERQVASAAQDVAAVMTIHPEALAVASEIDVEEAKWAMASAILLMWESSMGAPPSPAAEEAAKRRAAEAVDAITDPALRTYLLAIAVADHPKRS